MLQKPEGRRWRLPSGCNIPELFKVHQPVRLILPCKAQKKIVHQKRTEKFLAKA